MTINKIKYLIGKKYLNIITYALIFLLGFFVGRNYPDILIQAVVMTDKYSNLIVAIATVFLVKATVSLIGATLTQNKPLLYFYSESKPNMRIGLDDKPQLYIKNIGKGPAIEIKCRINKKEFELNALCPHEEKSTNRTIGNHEEIIITDIKYDDINDKSCSQGQFVL